jgi:formylglycine-generating enzyme required for sulfatase activity
MARIFISYSRKDEVFARQLATSLTASGADVWIDLEDIPAGMKWSSAIQDGLDQGDLMVVIISPDSMTSRNVEDEWQYYLDNGKPVIPVLLEPAKIHFQLARIQYIDFHKQPYGRALNQLYTEFRRKGVPLELAPNVQEKAPVSHIPPTQPIQRPTLQPQQAAMSAARSPLQRSTTYIIGAGVLAALLIGLIIGLLTFQARSPQPTTTPTVAVVQPTSADVTAPPATATLRPTVAETAIAVYVPKPGIDEPITRNTNWTPVVERFNGVDMALVPIGCFTMGISDIQLNEAQAVCPLNANTCNDLLSDERPQAAVCFEKPFWIDITEVTNGLFGSQGKWEGANAPRTNVTWQQSLAHCEGRGEGVRLPTEAEWEYAARGPDGLSFPWGNIYNAASLNVCDSNCEFDWRDTSSSDGYAYPAPVGSFRDGVSYDLAGNVWEWTSTIYTAYPYNANDGRENRGDTASQRTLRGSSWNWIALDARTTARDNPIQESSDWYGFRCVRDYTGGDL